MKIEIVYDRERDIVNILQTTQSKNSSKLTSIQSLYVEQYSDQFTKRELQQFLNRYFADNAVDINEEVARIQDGWDKIKVQSIKKLNKLFDLNLNEELTAFVTTDSRCTYNTDHGYFFVSFTSTSNSPNLIILHELLHFYTKEKYYDRLKEQGVSDKAYNDIKESLSVLLNIEFQDVLKGEQDKGYSQHQEMRRFIKEKHAINPDIDVLIKQLV